MGSFLWEDSGGCQHQQKLHNGRPLSVALTEPFDPWLEPQTGSFFDDIGDSFHQSDFACCPSQRQQRSRSSGRRYNRECYSLQYANSPPAPTNFYPPPPPRRTNSREMLVEKIQTVTIEEQLVKPPPRTITYVTVSPPAPVRQLKIRARPSSCYDLQHRSAERHHRRDDRWSKCVDEYHHESSYESRHRRSHERIVPIEREPLRPLSPPPKPRRRDVMTSTEDLIIPPAPLPSRPITRNATTDTTGLPRRPLCVTETQIIERYEQTENRHRDGSVSSTDGTAGSSTTMKRPLLRFFDEDDSDSKPAAPSSSITTTTTVTTVPMEGRTTSGETRKTSSSGKTKSFRKEFLQRMHARNGTRPHYTTDAERRREKNRVIVRPTSIPNEVLVDTSGIFGFPGEFSEPSSPLDIRARSRFQLPDLL